MIDRRSLLSGMASLASLPLLHAPAMVATRTDYHLLPPLPPHSPARADKLVRDFYRLQPLANDFAMPEWRRVVYQHMAGLRWCVLVFPDVDAVLQLEALADEWPRIKLNVDLVIEARIAADNRDWDWDYSRVRIDGGPPPREALSF